MLKKGALTLLVDYGGESSEDEVPGPGVSVKRLHENDEELHPTKIQRLPVPNIFLVNKVSLEHIDDPAQHDGKIRTFAHERGNWATYVYLPYEENEGINQLFKAIENYCVTKNIKIKKCDDFHISLTKTLILKHHWIDLFVNTIKTNVSQCKKFIILFDKLEIYCNEERTRTFMGLKIKTGYDSLLKLIEALNKSLRDFNLPPFYEEPSFHMSIAWCVGDYEEELKLLLPQLNHQLYELMDEYSQENWYIFVEYLLCKCGNKYFQFPLNQ